MLNNHTPLPSIIDNSNDIRGIFETIINYVDPFKSQNRKTKVLDVSNSYYWNEKTIKMFDVTKTNKIYGSAKEKKYNIILFEPPRNRKFHEVIDEHIDMFYDMLHENGIIVVRITDFKSKGRLCGSYDVKSVCDKYDLYLSDVIVYKNKYNGYEESHTKNIQVAHSSFMIFKKEVDLKSWH